jgi:hypothetical protein
MKISYNGKRVTPYSPTEFPFGPTVTEARVTRREDATKRRKDSTAPVRRSRQVTRFTNCEIQTATPEEVRRRIYMRGGW